MVQKGSEQRYRSLCGRIWISLARSAAFWTGFEHSARVAGKISLMQQISHNRPAADKGNISVERHHLRVNTVSHARMYKLYSLPSHWQRVPYCYYYLRVLYFANFCDLEKNRKIKYPQKFLPTQQACNTCIKSETGFPF